MRVLILLGAAACSAPGAPVAPVAVSVLPDVPFAVLDREQRARFMEERVVPAMAPLFRAHDARRYVDFGCTTCHGEADHAMPSPALPKLDLPDLEGQDRRAVEWMTTTIAPAMARLLDDPQLDCTRCHLREVR